jgi:hypothetical protein
VARVGDVENPPRISLRHKLGLHFPTCAFPRPFHEIRPYYFPLVTPPVTLSRYIFAFHNAFLHSVYRLHPPPHCTLTCFIQYSLILLFAQMALFT